jgi:hypothetical protein
MPDKTACPRCDRVGFVRLEHVIKAGTSVVHYYCGFCEHTWSKEAERPERIVKTPRARS